MRLLLSDDEKYANDKEKIKALVDHYTLEGEQQVYHKKERIRRLYNIANGVLNQEDYISYEEEKDVIVGQNEIDDAGLQFYPIIPPIIAGVLGDFDKKFSEYYAHAIDPEHTNMVIDRLTEQLRDALIQAAEAKFDGTTQEEYDAFMQSQEIVKYYLTDYRSEIEMWANHTIKVEKENLNVKEVERRTLEQILVTESPAVHVNFIDGSLTLESIPEENIFSLKSPYHDDYSCSHMVGWFEDLTISAVLNKYANLLSEDDVERITGWCQDVFGTEFVVNNFKYTGNRLDWKESTDNYMMFKRLHERNGRRYDDYQTDTVRLTYMYFLLPRRVGKLFYKGDGVEFSQIVSDDFKVTIKPEYRGKKKLENLIYGEHVDWFYINELWKCIQVDVKNTPWKGYANSTDQKTLYLYLDKNPIQYSDHKLRYGIRIPVHGGPKTNIHSEPISAVEKAAPLQVMYNWLYNRMQQLLSTEVGKFLIVNQNMIPQDSYDGSWGKNNLMKWFMVAHDTSIAPADPSVTNMGQSATQIAGGFGQVVDLTKTQELLEKANLARMLKEECFQQFGFTSGTLYGDNSPYQTGVSVAQQQQRALTQIQGHYTRLQEIMRRVWETILETKQFMVANTGMDTISYIDSDEARQIFTTNTDGFLMHKLGCFVKSSAADQQTLETIKQIALSTNTMGASTLEMATMISSTSTPELMKKLEKIQNAKIKERDEQAQAEAERQQKLVELQQRETAMALEEQAKQKELEFEREVVLQQIKSLGYANSPVEEIAAQIEKVSKNTIEERKLDLMREQVDIKKKQVEDKKQNDDNQLSMQEKIELTKLELRREEIEAAKARTKTLK